MRIRKIEIENYRRFERFSCDLHRSFTLLMGPNGSGKTSLLKAIYAALSYPFLAGGNGIDDQDVRRTDIQDPGGSKWRTPVYPAVVRLELEVEGGSVQLLGCRDAAYFHPHDSSRPSKEGFNTISAKRRQWLDPAYTEPVPVFARFGASNSVAGNGQPGQVQPPFVQKQQVWERAHSDTVDVNQLAQWFQYNELRTLQEGSAPAAYAVARNAVLSAIHAQDIRYIVRDNQLMVKHEEGWRPFDQLSDGQRRLAAIFLEIALRCAALNSHLGDQCVAKSPGIVLIDELDLHMHPRWQRAIVGDLLRVFPELQFIVASHSPFLLQAAFEHGQVVDVSTGKFAEPTDLSIEDIAESVMGVEQPQRGARFLELKRLAQAYYELLEQHPANDAEAAMLKADLDHALAAFANDPASAAWLEQRRLAAGH
jgi:predicted ATP-binding protein involved in virulence